MVPGLFHGFAFGAAMIRSELSLTVMYFFGLAVVQIGLVYSTAFVVSALWKATETVAFKARFLGALAAEGKGADYFLEHVEGMIV